MKKSDLAGAGLVLVHYEQASGKVIALAFPSDLTILAVAKNGGTLDTVAEQVPMPDGADAVLVLRKSELGALPDEVPHQHWKVVDGAVVAAIEPSQTGIVG